MTIKHGAVTVKFGGSVVTPSNFEIIKKVCKDERCYCVVSAIGREYDGDVKVTDLLHKLFYEITDTANLRKTVTQSGTYEEIFDKHARLIDKYRVNIDCKTLFEQAFKEFTLWEKDFVVSRGEYLAGQITAKYLGWDFLDSATCVEFDLNKKLLQSKSIRNIARAVDGRENIVLSGYYGRNKNGIVTFSRGGSDVSGALFAVATQSEIYENYVDVNGFLVCSPKIVDNPRTIPHISFSQMRQMDCLGADCLHRDSVLPLVKSNTVLHIRNYHNLTCEGTIVSAFPFRRGLISIVQEKLHYYKIQGENLNVKKLLTLCGNGCLKMTVNRQGVGLATQADIFLQLVKAFPQSKITAQPCFYTQMLFGGKPEKEKINAVIGKNGILSFDCDENTFSVVSESSVCQELYDALS